MVAKADLKRGEWTVGVTAAAAGFTPAGVPAIHGPRAFRVPLVVTITADGRVCRRACAATSPGASRACATRSGACG